MMNEDRLQSQQHLKIRAVLRIGGPIIAGIGLVFTLVGFGSVLVAAGNFELPRYFWCVFIGLPLLFVGTSMSMLGFIGAFQRYVASESAPVTKDVVNYMGENIQPGVKAVTKAMAEGVLEAQQEQQTKPPDPA